VDSALFIRKVEAAGIEDSLGDSRSLRQLTVAHGVPLLSLRLDRC